MLTPRVSFEVDSETPRSHSSSIVDSVVHFRYDGGTITRSDTFALPLLLDQSWLVEERGRNVNVGNICGTDRKQSVGIGCGCWRALNRGI